MLAINSSYGIFKENYRGYGIYWSGKYNVNGDGEFNTITETRGNIDQSIEQQEKQERNESLEKSASGDYLVVHRDGDNITVETPDGVLSLTVKQYRSCVFDLEAKYNKSVIFV